MKLCLGTFFRVFNLCRQKDKNDPHTVSQPSVFRRFFIDLLPRQKIESIEDSEISRIMTCKTNSMNLRWREQIRKSIEQKTLIAIQQQMWERVSTLIAPKMFEPFLYALTYIVRSDDSIGEHTPLNIGEEPLKTFGQLRMDDYETYVTSLFLYATLNTNNFEGARCLHEITVDFIGACAADKTVKSQKQLHTVPTASSQITTQSEKFGRLMFREQLIKLHQKSGMDEIIDWPFVFDKDEDGKIFIDSVGQFWFADEYSNWVISHLTLDKVDNMRYTRYGDEPTVDSVAVDSDDVVESNIYINFSTGDRLWLHNWHESFSVTISPTFIKTDRNAEIIEALVTACKATFMYLTVK